MRAPGLGGPPKRHGERGGWRLTPRVRRAAWPGLEFRPYLVPGRPAVPTPKSLGRMTGGSPM
eukprot:10921819-Lingulodinium_polyedra.AAC.1